MTASCVRGNLLQPARKIYWSHQKLFETCSSLDQLANMNQYLSLPDRLATMDLTPLPVTQNPVMSGAKILVETLRMVIETKLA